MTLTISMIAKVAGAAANDNMQSVLAGLQWGGVRFGLDQRQRLAHYLGQLAHESQSFRYDREIWGPTAAQLRYEGRTDLGNIYPGDGEKFPGHGPMQVTGRANHAEFRDWCRANVDPNAPDFEQNPELINTDPWEGLTGVWYWATRNLNRYADANDLRGVTRRINGGYNGLDDRFEKYDRAALVLLGFAPTDIRGFQADAGITIDGLSGPATRAAMHGALKSSSRVSFGDVATDEPSKPVPPVSGPKIDPVLRLGDRDESVRTLQQAFGLVDDGIFGTSTQAAVKGFQLGAGLLMDGVAGSDTWGALRDRIAND